ncbi:aspartokinase [bacterium BMS3Bbin11]|nr:aspartokinase [bacterium BMS3Abin11]GBE45320.1 aspartokinase [bacterium BMS3Bbin11]GMT41289.1 MAG: aspartokinase [bacterium]HDH08608.1 aspartate kinase [Gammaproteobacteria bacterium]HDH16566.1 aspartate kinase [Gammaproteobacteria bacterium]
MPIIVEKYGGTSVGSIERINAVADKVSKSHTAGDQMVIVVSAMSGETNRLLEMAYEISSHLPPREADVLVSTGEQVTIALLCMALIKRGHQARSYTGGQVRIETDTSHGRARIRNIDDSRIRRDLDDGKIIVVAGFQGVDTNGNITTLGRGGSDISAVALAVALKADECRIYTDVDGVYTADPRIVPEASRMDEVTFEEMLELSSLGAKVLQIRSVEFAGKYKVPLRVLSSFEDGPGTLISYEVKRNMERAVIAGIAHNADEAKLTITGVPDHPGVAHTILGRIAKKEINVDMIIQNVAADETTDFTFTVPRTEYENAKTILENVSAELGARGVTGDNTIAKVSIVGMGMRSHTGIADLMFATLAEEGINIRMISTSEIKVSVIIDDKYTELAVRALHKAFKLDQKQ